MAYARGKKALGQCDRCGFTVKLNELQYEIFDGKRRYNIVFLKKNLCI